MRKHIGWYIKGLPRNTEVKNAINQETDPEKVLKLLATYKDELLQNG